MEYLIDDLLLYSQCPMKLFFSKYLGIDDSTATVRGQINNIIRSCTTSFLGNYTKEEDRKKHDNITSNTYAKFNSMVSTITPPRDTSNNPKKNENYKSSIHEARYILERFVSNILSIDPIVLGAPYPYTLVINNHPYNGYIDSVYIRGNDTYVITLDTSKDYPSECIIDYGIRATINSYAFRSMTHSRFIDAIYWIPGNDIIEIHRSDGQYNTILRELDILVPLVEDCIEMKRFYRRYGYWCNNCSAGMACNESSKVI